MTMFPKVLPETVMRKNTTALSQGKDQKKVEPELPASFEGEYKILNKNRTILYGQLKMCVRNH